MEKTFGSSGHVCVSVCGECGSRDEAGMREKTGTNEEREPVQSEGQGLSLGSQLLLRTHWQVINPL